MDLKAMIREAERREIAKALIENGHNRTHTARSLGISRRTILGKIKRYGWKTFADVKSALATEVSQEEPSC